MDDPVRRYLDARARVEALDAQLTEAKQTRDEAERDALAHFERQGMQSVKLDGRTVYIERRVWARANEGRGPDIIEALREHAPDIVKETYNANTLTAWCREQEAQGIPLPPNLADAITLAEVFSLKVRKAS